MGCTVSIPITARAVNRLAPLAAGFEQGEHLYCLAQAHVVGKAPAEAEGAEELHPAQALALVGAQDSGEARRGVGGADALEVAHLLAGLLEDGVERRLGLRG